MRILHVINTLSAGGAELHLLTLCRHLKRQGAESTVAFLRREVKGSRSLHEEFAREAVPLIDLRGTGRFSLRGYRETRRAIRDMQPDIVHSHLPRGDLAAWYGRAGRDLPWVCSIHDIYSESWAGKTALPLLAAAWRRADRIIAISRAVRRWAVQACRVNASRIRVIHYGIESQLFTEPRRDLRAEWGLQERRILGTMGRLERRKGHDLMLRAMPHVLRRVPGAVLCIAGHDPWGYQPELETLVRKLNLGDHVRLTGFQCDASSFFHALDLFVFPTRSEGFGQVAVEAMAAGRAVVANRIAPLDEIVADGKSGLLADAENAEAFAAAIVKLLEDRTLAAAFGEHGRRRARELFSAERMADETIRVYRELLGPRTRFSKSSGAAAVRDAGAS